MKAEINGYEYDTKTASLMGTTFGPTDGPYWYKTQLYLQPGSGHFLYSEGGEQSLHNPPRIEEISPDKAEAWLEQANNWNESNFGLQSTVREEYL